ncbi:protein translocase subunit SecD [Thalassotalea marina]|uniref:Protein translocase subunit SecD n=2 Tax=Thalassotalea marina TaxID=1673741 RepID=A0A919EP02_9GAMM|nr:protein translocase subunit SecD [Thalassotalea marina]
MLISALPNLYTDKVKLTLTNSGEHQQQTTPKYFKDILAQANIPTDEIRVSNDEIVITLHEAADQKFATESLKQQLADGYQVTSSLTNEAPAWLNAFAAKPIKLGLDLSGGVLFVLEVDTDRAQADRIKNIGQELKAIALENKIRAVNVSPLNNHALTVDLTRASNEAKDTLFPQITKTYPELSIKKEQEHKYLLSYTDEAQQTFRQETMKQTLKTMRGRIEELGITEAITQKQGKNRIRIELPGVHDPAEAKRIIGATASLEFYQLASNTAGFGVIHIKDENGRQLALNGKAIFSGSNIKNAVAGRDDMGQPLVNLTLDGIGGKKMSNFSKKNIGKPMATVFSEFYRNADNQMLKTNKIINVATIQQHLGSQFSITNLSSHQTAQELALLLRAGSLTAPVTIVQQRSIEATLGEANIDNGIKALTVGVSITLLFMAFWYRSLGLVANVALGLNLLSLLGLMSLLPGAVLTLPGIAGLVLTVGMAVDTNVLIFERIKEELKRGRKTLAAIESGYNNAFTTILDANITTMITGVILYAIGYGAVKGFAIILCLGILTSMFTGVFVSKALTGLLVRENKAQLLGVKS